jgi:nucleotide-binding universal stress UspA family protein
MIQRTNVIVVGVDGSPAAEAAAHWAADEADRRRAGLHLVRAYSIPVGYAGPGAIMSPLAFDEARHAAEASLETVKSKLLSQHPGLDVRVSVGLTTPFAALRDASEHALLTVVGSHGTGVFSETILGSVALKIASHGPAPVVVLRTDPHDRPAAPIKPAAAVMVGLDDSPQSQYALGFAFEEASLREVPLVAVHSWDDKLLNSFLRAYPLDIDRDSVDVEQGRRLAEQLAGWTEKYPDVPASQLVVRGSPAGALLRTSAQLTPCLLVVGSRGRGGFTGLLLGSTSAEVLAYASCPVAVVHNRTGG